MKYWLLKTEPDVFSLDDLKQMETDRWDGVRNYQARNNLTAMKCGDIGLFYHSRATPPHVAGLCRVTKKAYPDPTAFDAKAKYYDSKSDPAKPRWFCPEVSYLCHFPNAVSLTEIRGDGRLSKMVLVNNTRLSVQPVSKAQFLRVCKMGGLDDIPRN